MPPSLNSLSVPAASVSGFEDQVSAESGGHVAAPADRVDGGDLFHTEVFGQADVDQSERPAPDDERGLRVRHPGKFLPVVGARHRFDDGGLSGRHSGHRHQVLPGHRGDPHILGQAAGELVAEGFPVAADVFVSLAAGRAFPAGHQGVHRDLVAHGHAVGQRAVGGDHGAGELVAQHGGEGDVFLLAALIDANVGAAHQRRVHPQQHVAGLKIRDGHLLDPQVVGLVQHGLAQSLACGWA